MVIHHEKTTIWENMFGTFPKHRGHANLSYINGVRTALALSFGRMAFLS